MVAVTHGGGDEGGNVSRVCRRSPGRRVDPASASASHSRRAAGAFQISGTCFWFGGPDLSLSSKLNGVVGQAGSVAVGALTLRAAETPASGAPVIVMVRPHRVHIHPKSRSGCRRLAQAAAAGCLIERHAEQIQNRRDKADGVDRRDREQQGNRQRHGRSRACRRVDCDAGHGRSSNTSVSVTSQSSSMSSPSPNGCGAAVVGFST
jgi:hypothetical protein